MGKGLLAGTGLSLGCGCIPIFALMGGVTLGVAGFNPVVAIVLIMGAIIFIAGSMFAKRLTGPCPYCGKKIEGAEPGFTCRACKRRVLVRETEFWTID